MLGNLEQGQRNERRNTSPRRSSRKGECRLGREFVVWGGMEGAGRWPYSPWHEEAREMLRVLPLLVSLLRHQNCPGFLVCSSKVLLQHLFQSLVQSLWFLNGALAGPFPKTVRGLAYPPVSPTLNSRSSHISNRKHSVATCIFLINPRWTSCKQELSQLAVYFFSWDTVVFSPPCMQSNRFLLHLPA